MFLSNFNLTKQQNAEPFTYLYGYNGLNMNYIHDVYMNTCASLIEGATPSPSTSPSSSSVASDTGSLLLSPISMCSKANNTFMGYGDNPTIENLAALQHRHHLAAHHEQLSTSALGQPQHFFPRNRKLSQINNTNIAFPSIYRQDEISKSLKMFAMLTAYSNNAESAISNQQVSQSPVDGVMQDFASNGYISDDLNCRPYGKHYCANSVNQKSSCSNQQLHNNNGIRATDNSALSQQKLHSIQKQNVNNHFWKTLPTYVQQNYNPITVAAAAAASDNIDYNCNQRKFCKRYNGAKNEKYVSAKHCVFCENNNEPEPVVKSHAVRDSLGRVLCPKLRTYVCPICKASGDMAHTVKYCPQKPIITMEDAIKAESFRLVRANCYKQQMKL